jgi:hypothetical protein
MGSGVGTRKGGREKKKGIGAGRRSKNRSGKMDKDWLTPQKKCKNNAKTRKKNLATS